MPKAHREFAAWTPQRIISWAAQTGTATAQVSATSSADRSECRAVVVDITAQKQVERALRESERRFRDVAAISADWIWEVDLEGRYTYASESVQTLLGYAPQDILGKTAFDLMPPEEALRVGQEFAAIAMRGRLRAMSRTTRGIATTSASQSSSARRVPLAGPAPG